MYSFYTAVVNNVLHGPYLLLTNSSFTLLLSESQEMFNLGQICQNSEGKFESQLNVINHALFSDKVHSFSQSEYVLYGNFTMFYRCV